MKPLRRKKAWLPAEELSAHWARVHGSERFAFSASEVHYLRTLAMALDDDFIALLLLKKLRMAAEIDPVDRPRDVVGMNSLVRFTFNGDESVGRLSHPACCGPDSLSIASCAGTGLVGMRSGQTVLWPDARGALRPLRVDTVARPPARKSRSLQEGIG